MYSYRLLVGCLVLFVYRVVLLLGFVWLFDSIGWAVIIVVIVIVIVIATFGGLLSVLFGWEEIRLDREILQQIPYPSRQMLRVTSQWSPWGG